MSTSEAPCIETDSFQNCDIATSTATIAASACAITTANTIPETTSITGIVPTVPDTTYAIAKKVSCDFSLNIIINMRLCCNCNY